MPTNINSLPRSAASNGRPSGIPCRSASMTPPNQTLASRWATAPAPTASTSAGVGAADNGWPRAVVTDTARATAAVCVPAIRTTSRVARPSSSTDSAAQATATPTSAAAGSQPGGTRYRQTISAASTQVMLTTPAAARNCSRASCDRAKTATAMPNRGSPPSGSSAGSCTGRLSPTTAATSAVPTTAAVSRCSLDGVPRPGGRSREGPALPEVTDPLPPTGNTTGDGRT